MAASAEHDVIVLDILLPKLDGLSVLGELRNLGVKTHVLMLTAKDTVEDRVKGLGMGADDYIVKPFAFEELLARIQALIRRNYGVKTTKLTFGVLEIDLARRTVARASRELKLKPREYALLEYLALRAGRLVTRTEIERHIYDERADVSSNVVDSAICSLRKEIDEPGRPSMIQTRRGMGYLFDGSAA
jgi:DNA-binding response OmpR family regulator